MRKLEKSSDRAQTQGLSQQSCQLSRQMVRLRAARAATSTRDRSKRRVNCHAAPASRIHRGRARPMRMR